MIKKLMLLIFIIMIFISCGNEKIIRVTGVSSINIVPDYIHLIFEISIENRSHKKCQEENFNIAQKAIELLKNKYNIPDDDIQTTDYYLKKFNKEIKEDQYISMFISKTEISVNITRLSDLRDILSDLIEEGVTGINNIDFKVSNYKDIENKALEEAVKNAKEKAGRIAKSENLKLISIKRMFEVRDSLDMYSFGPEGPPGYEGLPVTPYMDNGIFQKGEKEIKKNVIVEFLIK